MIYRLIPNASRQLSFLLSLQTCKISKSSLNIWSWFNRWVAYFDESVSWRQKCPVWSEILVEKALPVWPMFNFLEDPHSNLYTPDFSPFFTLLLLFFMTFPNVLLVLKAVLIFSLLQKGLANISVVFPK